MILSQHFYLFQYELEKFDDIYSDAKWLEGKTAKKMNGRTEIEATPGQRNAKFT